MADSTETATNPRDVRIRTIRAVRNHDITRNPRGLRWWTSETESRTLTAAEKRHLRYFLAEGLVRFERKAGTTDGRYGYYVLDRPITPADLREASDG